MGKLSKTGKNLKSRDQNIGEEFTVSASIYYFELCGYFFIFAWTKKDDYDYDHEHIVGMTMTTHNKHSSAHPPATMWFHYY